MFGPYLCFNNVRISNELDFLRHSSHTDQNIMLYLYVLLELTLSLTDGGPLGQSETYLIQYRGCTACLGLFVVIGSCQGT